MTPQEFGEKGEVFGEGGHVRGGVMRRERIGLFRQGFAGTCGGFILCGQGVIGVDQGAHVLMRIRIARFQRVGTS